MSEKKKDLVDFIKEDLFGKHGHTAEFCQMVDNIDTTPENLGKTMRRWGYKGVTTADCGMVLLFARGAGLSFKELEPRY